MLDRTKGPSLALPSQEVEKQVPAPKLRRKLQKVKRPVPGVPNEAANKNSTGSNNSDTPPKISLPLHLPPDLSDSKWSEYLRSSGYLCENLISLPDDLDISLRHANNIVPELSHLTANHDTTPRSSSDTLEGSSSDSSTASVRRRAKTPVFHVGQLEARERARKVQEANQRAAQMREAMEEGCVKRVNFRNSIDVAPLTGGDEAKTANIKETNIKEATANNVTVRETSVREVIFNGNSGPRPVGNEATAQKAQTREGRASNVSLIAEQYKALIDPDVSRFMESRPSTPHSTQQEREGLTIRHKRRSGDLRRDSQIFEHATVESPQGSPNSVGTLVAFEEETIYFKPLSFGSDLSLPVNNYDTPTRTSPLPTPNNIGLKICVDLLAKDLASSVEKNDQQLPSEASALQIWTMIEAYEKLRDRIRGSALPYDEAMSLEQSFETWLQALYTAHDRLTGADGVSESNYDDPEE